MMEATAQVIASQKSWRSLALSLYVFLHNASAGPRGGGGGGGGGGARVRPTPNEEAVSVLNNFCSGIICTVMVWWSLGSFGVFQWTTRLSC